MLQKIALVLFVGVSFSLSLLLMPGCKRNHATASSEHTQLIILFATDVDGVEFAARYPSFGLSNSQRVSRSENKWQFDWKMKASKRDRTLQQLKGCEEVISVEEAIDNITSPSNSTNSGHTKTKPIKNQ